MQILQDIFTNKYVYIPTILWLSIQLFKIVCDAIEEHKINWRRITGSGGMPSAHSAVVCCMSVFVGRDYGFSSSVFALALLFAIIVMYDACGVRRAAGKQAKVLNKIIATPELAHIQVHERLKELLGHTPVQVIAGAIIGFIVGAIF